MLEAESSEILDTYKQAYLREKEARKTAESLLEERSREIYQKNQDLEKQYLLQIKRANEYQILHEFAEYGRHEVATDKVLQFCVDKICYLFSWPVGHVCKISDDNVVKHTNIWYLSNPISYQSLVRSSIKKYYRESSTSIVRQAINSSKVIWSKIEKESDDIILSLDELAEMKVGSMVVIPVSVYGKMVWALKFYLPDSQNHDSDIMSIIDICSLQIGTVLERRISEKEKLDNHRKLLSTVKKLQTTQSQLVQSEKMASVGQLAAGVAHEINNPIAYVSSNMTTLKEYIDVFSDIIALYENAFETNTQLQEKYKTTDFAFIKEDVKTLLEDSSFGLERVREIVSSLKNYSRSDSVEMHEADINQCIQNTLKMLNNQVKYKAEVVTDLQEIPRIVCNAGKLNQVFTNLIVNAGHAIENKGQISISSCLDGENIVIKVSDTGKGIPKEHIENLFDPFFTTKPVGEGTGLGLSISYGIVKDHGGEISVDSIVGKGTTFTISIPNTINETIND